MSTWSRNIKILLVAFAGALAIGGVSIALAAREDDGPVPVAEPNVPEEGIYRPGNPAPELARGVSPEVKEAFAIFSRPATERDRTSGDYFIINAGANPDLARLALVKTDGSEVHLVPAQGSICISTPGNLEAGCIRDANAVSGDNAQSIICAPGLPNDTVEIYGLLPDGATKPTVQHADRTSVPLDVTNNLYIYRSDRKKPLPTELQFTLNGETRTVPTNVPGDAHRENCG